MDEDTDLLLLYEVARLYYEDGFTQEEIAERLGFSRSRVQRLLEAARREGIVEIHLVSPGVSFAELEEALVSRFHLKKAIVVPAPPHSLYLVRRSIGRAAARYLEATLRDGDVLGIGWGRTIYETLGFLKRKAVITIVPLIGAVGQVEVDFQVNELGAQLARRIGGFFVPFYAPALVDSENIAQALFSDQSVRRVVDLWNEVTVALVGMGDPRREGSIVPKFFLSDPSSAAILKRDDVVGDVLYHFLKGDGTLADATFDRRVMSIPLEKLKGIPHVVGVAGSLEKVEVVEAVLRGGYVNVLVTDQEVARKLLERSEKGG
ncbi:MAG: sugar-binding transcriptional regulator [Candidatus Caldatribacterium sp.]|uniref:sugar-binding transcriptional regulator n=1 Tax=Candidatus Caldatribacterium sp. TaxID=2282143 RepID=UPI0029997E24|nr:sugar-binding transcriptional regulator [Candidatus Caldatribacterium sp.]MCX7731221.1 sugar-binding transcriptional regulator [Candidatus Caldatribacterium sp.]MDW8081048.1 sugar-binding transcriptional regulator [Candidatus Calescibacterium sp.]